MSSMKYPYRDLGVPFDRKFRNDLNANFDDIEHDIRMIGGEAAQQALEAAEEANTQAIYAQTSGDYAQDKGDYAAQQGDYAQTQGNFANEKGLYAQQQGDYAKAQGDYAKQVGDENKTRWLNPVATFADIATTYPNPQHGDTVMVTDDGENSGSVYRYENGQWNLTQKHNDLAIADVQNKIGILSDSFPLKKDEEVMLISSFNGNNGEELDLYITRDGENFLAINLDSVFRPSGSYLRDPSMMYWNGYFYVAYTTGAADKVFGIARTRDFRQWEEYTITIPGTWTNCWAPEWFVDGNNVYIILSLSDGTRENDINGRNIPYHKQYYMKATNVDLTQFTAPVEMPFSQTSNKIDSFIFKENGTYHCFVKNEYNKTIEHYTITGNTIEGATWQYQQTISFPVRVEGPCCVKFKEKYYLYADGFDTSTTWLTTSTDLTNWGTAKQIQAVNKLRTQHFTAFVLPEEAKTPVSSLINEKFLYQINTSTAWQLSETNAKKRYELKNYVSNGVFTPPEDGGLYVVLGNDSVTITSVNVPDYSKIRRYLLSVQGNGSITLKNGNNILTPNNTDFVISPSTGRKESVFELVSHTNNGNHFRIYGGEDNKKLLYPSTRIDLASLATGGIINSLQVMDGYYYYVDGSNAVTINGFDLSQLNGFATIYFCVESGLPSASITIKSGTGVVTPNDVDFVMNDANKLREVVVTFIRPTSNASVMRLRY